MQSRQTGWNSRQFSMLFGRSLIPCVVWLTLSQPLEAADWPMGRANPQGTGATPDELPPDLQLLWQFDIDGLGFDAGPIIADGKVFANDHDGRVLAIALDSGTEEWRQELDTGFVASPAYRDGVLYAADYDGNLRAMDASSGKELWHFETGYEINGSPNFYGEAILFTSQDGALYAVRQTDGKLIWKYETGDQLQCGATLAGSRTFLGGCDGHLHVVDVEKGTGVAEPLPLDAPTGSTPCVLGGQVLVPTYAGEIFAFRMPSTDQQWRFRDTQLADEFKNSVAVTEGLAVATSRNKRVFAVDTKTAEVEWVQVLRKRADASPVIAGNSVIVATADGRILRYDLMTGKETWMFEVKGAFIGSAAAANGKLVLANDRGSIFLFW